MSKHTVKAETYFSVARAEAEWRCLWTKAWHMGPRVQEILEPGDGFLHTFGKESLVFVRQDDGIVAGFYNVCRHRGNRIFLGEDGPLAASQFSCAFHGWKYGRDGALKEVPYAERFAGITLDRNCGLDLKRFRVECFAGWTWFTLDPEAPTLDAYLGSIAPRLADYRMENAQIVDYKTFEFDCNWKTTLDAFNESYHFLTLHSEILDWGNEDAPITFLGIHSMMINEYGAPSPNASDPGSLNPSLRAFLQINGIDPATFEGKPSEVRLEVQRLKRAQAAESLYPYRSLTDSQLTDAYHYLLFPSVHFNLFPEFYVAMRYRPHPSGDAQKMYFDFIMCAPVPGDRPVPPYEHRVVKAGSERVADVLQWGEWTHPAVNQVLEQDVQLLEHVQRGLRSDSFTEPVLGDDEVRIQQFHAIVDRLVSGESTIPRLIAEVDPTPLPHCAGEDPPGLYKESLTGSSL